MKALCIVAITITVLKGSAFSQIASQGPAVAQTPNTSAKTKHKTAFFCDRSALTPEQRKRHFDELGPTLRSLWKGVRELEDGYEFEFPADLSTFQAVAEWTIQERSCCPFFDLDVRLEREGGPLLLRLTGREGVKEFIKAEFRLTATDKHFRRQQAHG